MRKNRRIQPCPGEDGVAEFSIGSPDWFRDSNYPPAHSKDSGPIHQVVVGPPVAATQPAASFPGCPAPLSPLAWFRN